MTARGVAALDSYIYGSARQEQSLPFENAEQAAVVAETMLAAVSASDFPYLHEFMVDHVMQPAYDYGAEFFSGLDLILDALERELDSTGATE
jgi:hypothetical protein